MDWIMSNKLFQTRQGTIFLGLIAAVIAFVALIVYLNNYRNSINQNATSPVLVASQPIQIGTSGDVLTDSGFAKVTNDYAKSAIPGNAITDPAALKGLVVVKPIYQGHMLTMDDFGPATNSLAEVLKKNDRAVSVPLGAPQQVGNEVTAGSHVDVWVTVTGNGNGFGCTYEILHNVYVLSANNGIATLKADPREAGRIVWAANVGQVWLTLAPTIATTKPARPVCTPSGG